MDLYFYYRIFRRFAGLVHSLCMAYHSDDCKFLPEAKQGQKKGIRDAWTYGASIVVIYVALGLAITLIFGASALNALSTNAVFNILFCLMLIVFAASFFGAFELTLPANGVRQWIARRKLQADY